MDDLVDAAPSRFDRWKRSLLDLTLRNRLLDAKDGRQIIPLCGDALDVAHAMEVDPTAGFGLAAHDASARPGSIQAALAANQLFASVPLEELDRRLIAIARAAREQLSEGGARTLWLGLGVLRWFDRDEPEVPRHAPLLLVPMELRRVGARDRYRVSVVSEEDWRWNDTLLEKMFREYGISIERSAVDAVPTADDMPLLLNAVAAAIGGDGREGWAVLPEVRLGIFSFTKFAMWTDLERLSRMPDQGPAAPSFAPVVRHLAAGDRQAFPDQGAFPDPDHLDRDVALADLYAPLDCDASQLAAILAAAQGKSFVLQGPPGTGKSQTIANLIAQCLATGRTVLFVSEKIAALEVVQRRLAGAGLSDFCMPLHSHRAKKREVVAELGRVLERVWRPGAATGDDVRLESARSVLNGHAHALHETGRAGVNVHDALARLADHRGAPQVGGGDATAAMTAAEVSAQHDAAVLLTHAAAAVAPIASHPWRGSTLECWQVTSGEDVAAVVVEVQAAIAAVLAAVAALPAVVPGLVARSCEDLDVIGALAEVVLASPRPGAELVYEAGGGADSRSDVALLRPRLATTLEAAPKDVTTWLHLEQQRRRLDSQLGDRFTARVFELDTARLSETFRAWAGRFFLFRWIALRGPRKLVHATLTPGPMLEDAVVATDLDSVEIIRKTDGLLDAARPAVRRWLGALADAAEPDADLGPIETALAWVGELRAAFDRVAVDPAGRDGAWRALVGAVSDGGGDGKTGFAELACAVKRWRVARAQLAAVCAMEVAGGDLDVLSARAAEWAAAPGTLRDWVAYVRARQTAHEAGLAGMIARLEDGSLAVADLVPAWERAFLIGVARGAMARSKELAGFHGAGHHARVAEFISLDRAQLGRARARTIARLAERVPRLASAKREANDTGEIGVLLHELKKQRRHKPLRALFGEIPTLLTRLKPCLLMSPLSVAQYLDHNPGGKRFDLVVFDEASQIPTADAIGALARGEAAVIVGDSRQLPPTRFFSSTGSSTDSSDDEERGGGDELESVLDECVASRLPELRLTWHYRSRHHELIEFANDRYYDGRLEVFPAPTARAGELGVAWRKVNGVYDRGGTRTNRIEAEAVVAEVVARLRDPVRSKKSLGVVTFSKAQQQLVLDLLDEARRGCPELDRFFAAQPTDDLAEPVLVKNLETIQGDERDVILFSIGYGPDVGGGVSLNFGPLNRDGGERRLNVAITRAREQLVVFSSLEPEQIAADASARGLRDLAALLAYARGGGHSGALATQPPATLVTAEIARVLEERGMVVHHQVGCAGYRIDLAVVDPADPSQYVLGIETDGPAYVRATTARDRDRLRAEMLGNLGWRLHRIWTLDWWHDAEREIQRLHSAVIAAIAATRAARTPRPLRTTTRAPAPRPAAPVLSAGTSVPVPSTVRAVGSSPPAGGKQVTALDRAMSAAPAIAPYKVASVPPGRWTVDDFYDRARESDLRNVIAAVLAVEAPMQLSLLARRVGAYFGIGRVTDRVSSRIRVFAGDRGTVGGEGDPDVIWRLDQDPSVWSAVRVPATASETRREVDELPLAEIVAAALVVLHRNRGLPAADLSRETAKLLGIARQGEKVTKRMADGVVVLAAKGLCVIEGDRVNLV